MKNIGVILLSLVASFGFATEKQKILILGDSISEGYGVAKDQAYPAVLQGLLDKAGKNYEVVSASISGSTTASGPARLRWFLKQKPSLLILALGANDGLRGLNLQQSEANLQETMTIAKKADVRVILAGMQLPPNYGETYRQDFRNMFARLAKTQQADLIPFLLEGVGGVAELNQADGIHPNAKGHAVIAKTVFKSVQTILK